MKTGVLALVTDAFGGRGGIAQYNRDFLSALAAVGYSVVAIPRLAPNRAYPTPGVLQQHPRMGRIGYSIKVIAKTWRSKPKVVFCGHIYMAPLAWLAAKLARTRLVLQAHGIEAWSRPSWIVRWSCERASTVLCVSRYTRARLLDWAAIPPERVMVLPNTVADCFTPGDGAALRQEWGLGDKKVLLTVGRMWTNERYKGQDRVIEALPNLIAAGHDIVYVISGEGDDRPRLERLALKLGVSGRVRFVGALPRETLIEAYRMADLFVMPSTGEGFGIAFLEAMACGTRALGLDAAGTRDALCDGELGQMAVEKEFRETLARMISTAGPNSQVLFGAVREHFGLEHFVNAVRSAILRLVEVQ